MQNKVKSHESEEGVGNVRCEDCDAVCLNDSDKQPMRRRTLHSVSSNGRAHSIFERYGAEF